MFHFYLNHKPYFLSVDQLKCFNWLIIKSLYKLLFALSLDWPTHTKLTNSCIYLSFSQSLWYICRIILDIYKIVCAFLKTICTNSKTKASLMLRGQWPYGGQRTQRWQQETQECKRGVSSETFPKPEDCTFRVWPCRSVGAAEAGFSAAGWEQQAEACISCFRGPRRAPDSSSIAISVYLLIFLGIRSWVCCTEYNIRPTPMTRSLHLYFNKSSQGGIYISVVLITLSSMGWLAVWAGGDDDALKTEMSDGFWQMKRHYGLSGGPVVEKHRGPAWAGKQWGGVHAYKPKCWLPTQ